MKVHYQQQNLDLESKESIIFELKTTIRNKEDSHQTQINELIQEKADILLQKNDLFKLLEDANRQNKRFGQEIKLLKNQLASLEQKNTMGQQLTDSLKKELLSLRDEKAKLLDEMVFFYFLFKSKENIFSFLC